MKTVANVEGVSEWDAEGDPERDADLWYFILSQVTELVGMKKCLRLHLYVECV